MNAKNLYHQVYDHILTQYQVGNIPLGGVLPSEHELAMRLAISRVSVRSGYKLLNDAGIIERLKGKGTFLTVKPDLLLSALEGMSVISNKLIGFMAPEFESFYPKIFKGIEEEAHKNDFSLSVALNSTQQKEIEALEKFVASPVSGVIMTPNRFLENRQNIAYLNRCSIPFVMVGKPPINVRCNAVYTDDIGGSYEAVKLMHKNGYSQAVHVTDSKADTEAVYERKTGYLLGVEQYFPDQEPIIIDIQSKSWLDTIRSLIISQRTGFLLVEDKIAPSIYNVILRLNLCFKKDVGVLGTNNSSLCEQIEPQLSSIAHMQEDEGKLAFLALLDMLRGNIRSTGVSHILLDTKIIMRDSL